MTSATLQRILAAIFLILGTWCMLLPRMVEQLTIRPEHQVLTPANAETVVVAARESSLPMGRVTLLAERAARSARGWLEEQA